MKNVFYILALLCMILVSGCASTQDNTDDPLTPMPVTQTFNDPDNARFMNAVAEYIHAHGAPGNTQYEFTRIDLNGDGRREGIVLMKSPHQYWCGFNGCSMVVFQAHNDHFELKSEIAPVRGPLMVSDKKTNGWNDIVVRVSGRMNLDTKDVALQFNGNTYPTQPAHQPSIQYAYNNYGGVKIFP
ncbi:MAG: hypothetical protein H6867_07110 [Rhodospirillales bacterium]|nr:hypothetical protein [Rhodospirillales bacterium]MCB9995319.1 hypothetical protein [Rhodospirillales bacterium]